MNDLKLITFDLDDTLWDVAPVIIKAQANTHQWLTDHVEGVTPYLQPESLKTAWQQVRAENPELTHDLGIMRRLVYESVICQAGVPKPQAEKQAAEAFTVFLDGRHEVEYFPGALDALGVLSQRFTLAALTDGNADVKRLGLDCYFSFAYTAASAGAAKPDPTMFRLALKKANVQPTEALHVGDSLALDIAAAAAVGMHTMHICLAGEPHTASLDVTPTLVASNMQHMKEKILAFAAQL